MSADISTVISAIPYRLALAGGWIDQPFLSRLNPTPPGSMVTVSLEPVFPFMDRSGMATGTRKVARKLWNGRLPEGDPQTLVRQLYAAENEGFTEPSGSQDMIGLIYPGVCRLDYDAAYEGGVFPRHIECNTDPAVARWIERVIHMLPVAPRPQGYNPLEEKNLDPRWVRRLGESGKDCFEGIVRGDVSLLGKSMNQCMECWAALLPNTVRHRTVTADLPGLLAHYQSQYAGAMYSGCGGGYLYIVSEKQVPGTFNVRVRTS